MEGALNGSEQVFSCSGKSVVFDEGVYLIIWEVSEKEFGVKGRTTFEMTCDWGGVQVVWYEKEHFVPQKSASRFHLRTILMPMHKGGLNPTPSTTIQSTIQVILLVND